MAIIVQSMNIDNKSDLEQIMDKSINKMIFEQVYDKYNKFIWKESNFGREYCTSFNFDNVTIINIYIDKESATFRVVINKINKIVVDDDDTEQKRFELVEKINRIYKPISKQEIYKKLKEI